MDFSFYEPSKTFPSKATFLWTFIRTHWFFFKKNYILPSDSPARAPQMPFSFFRPSNMMCTARTKKTTATKKSRLCCSKLKLLHRRVGRACHQINSRSGYAFFPSPFSLREIILFHCRTAECRVGANDRF